MIGSESERSEAFPWIGIVLPPLCSGVCTGGSSLWTEEYTCIFGTKEATGVSTTVGDATIHTRVHTGHRC